MNLRYKKIIISSVSLFKYVLECIKDVDVAGESKIEVSCDNNSFSIPSLSENSIYCESNTTDKAEITMDFTRILRLKKILQCLDEQPLVLTFDIGNDWLHISDAII